MRSLGYSYREFEAQGLMLVVAEMNVRYQGAAVFDDILLLTTHVQKARGVRIHHGYRLIRVEPDSSESLIVEAESTIACVDRDGKVQRLPDYLRTN